MITASTGQTQQPRLWSRAGDRNVFFARLLVVVASPSLPPFYLGVLFCQDKRSLECLLEKKDDNQSMLGVFLGVYAQLFLMCFSIVSHRLTMPPSRPRISLFISLNTCAPVRTSAGLKASWRRKTRTAGPRPRRWVVCYSGC